MSMKKRITDAFSARRQSDEVDNESSARTEEVQDMVSPSDTADLANPNQAEHYGVGIESMLPQNADRYWRVRLVRHLTPEENQGRHHLFIRVMFANDQAEEAPILIEWDNGQQELVYSRDQREPYQAIAMFTWQTCRVQMRDAPSEAVTGLTANHPDELNEDGSRSGNTLFHHSFEIEFEEVAVPQHNSQIHGRVVNGTDLLLQLLSDNTVLGEGAIPDSGEFRFNAVPTGAYVVQVTDPESGTVRSQSRVLNLDGTNSEEVVLEVIDTAAQAAQSPASGVLPITQSPDTPTPNPVESPGSTTPSQQTMDGEMQAATVPAPPVQTIEHYILFGPRDHFATRVYLPLLLNQLMEANVTFGFNPQEAVHAKRVTILASPDVLPSTLDQELQQQGIIVQRVHGDLAQIKTAIGLD